MRRVKYCWPIQPAQALTWGVVSRKDEGRAGERTWAPKVQLLLDTFGSWEDETHSLYTMSQGKCANCSEMECCLSPVSLIFFFNLRNDTCICTLHPVPGPVHRGEEKVMIPNARSETAGVRSESWRDRTGEEQRGQRPREHQESRQQSQKSQGWAKG